MNDRILSERDRIELLNLTPKVDDVFRIVPIAPIIAAIFALGEGLELSLLTLDVLSVGTVFWSTTLNR